MKKTVSVLVLLIFLSGCSQLKNLGFKNYANNFTMNLKNNTAGMVLYRDFTTIAIAKATHFNKQLMEQYIKYTQNVNPAESKKYKDMIKEFDKYDIYWLAFYTPDDDINNLASTNSFWNVYLSKGSTTLNAAYIKEIGINDMTKQWLYLLKFNRWARQYVIKFKKTNLKGKPTLILSSFLGTIEIKFNN